MSAGIGIDGTTRPTDEGATGSRRRFPRVPVDTYDWALTAWIAFGVGLVVKCLLSPWKHSTFGPFAAGSLCWWADANLYDPVASGEDFRYSPTFAVLFSAFALWPARLGACLWAATNAAVLFAALRSFLHDVVPERWSSRKQGLFLLLVLVASARGLWASQSNTLVFALVACGAAALVRGRPWRAALLLAAPVHVKLWPLAAGLLCAARHPRRLGLRLPLAVGLFALVPFATKSPTVVLEHYRNWFAALVGPMQIRHEYRDAWTIWELAFGEVDPHGYAVLQGVSALGVLGLCLWQRRRDPQSARGALFVLGTWTAWQLMFGPGTERNTFCLIAPLTAWGLLADSGRIGTRMLLGAGYGLITLFSFGLFERLLIDAVPWVTAAAPIGAALFLAGLVAYEMRAGNGEALVQREEAQGLHSLGFGERAAA